MPGEQSLTRQQHCFPSFLPSLSLHCADGLPAGIARGRIARKALPSTGQLCPSVEGPTLLPSGDTWSPAESPQEEPLILFPFPTCQQVAWPAFPKTSLHMLERGCWDQALPSVGP